MFNGEVLPPHMRREGIDEECLMAARREHGVAEISGVEVAVLEIDSSISVAQVGGAITRVKKPLKYLRHQ